MSTTLTVWLCFAVVFLFPRPPTYDYIENLRAERRVERIQGDPRLPPELERYIFQLAAEPLNGKVARLLLVARRVHFWLLPYRHQTLLLGRSLPYEPQRAFLKLLAARAYPLGAIGRCVRFLVVHDEHHLRQKINDAARARTESIDLEDVLEACTQLEGLFWDFMTTDIPADVLACLSTRLRRLSAPVPQDCNLILDPRRAALLRRITHLEPSFPAIPDGGTEGEANDQNLRIIRRLLARLPALTHLALLDPLDARMLVSVLDECKTLQILVVLARDARLESRYARWLVQNGVTDSRVVVLVERSWYECVSEAEESYWRRAEVAIAQRAAAP